MTPLCDKAEKDNLLAPKGQICHVSEIISDYFYS